MTEHMELWREVQDLGLILALAKQREPDSEPPLYDLFYRTLVEAREDGTAPDVAKLLAARDAFYGLPLEQQRQLLNGWSPVPPPGRPTLGELFQVMQGHQYPRRVLSIMAQPASAPSAVMTFGHDFRPTGTAAALRIEIAEGMTKSDVLKSFQEAAKLVIDHWPQLIDSQRITEVGMTVPDPRTIPEAGDLLDTYWRFDQEGDVSK